MKHPSVDVNRIKNLLLAVAFSMALLLPTTVFGQEGQNAAESQIAPAATPNAVVVKTVTVNLKDGLITIVGTNLGTSPPTITLDSTQLVPVPNSFGPGPDPGTQQFMAYLPAAFLPPSLKPGTHLLMVSTGGGVNQATEFDTAFVVSTFNGRPGDVTLTLSDVTGALGYTPQSQLTAGTGISISGGAISNLGVTSLAAGGPGAAGISLSGSTGNISIGNNGVLSFNSRNGAVNLSSNDVTNVLSAGTGISITSSGTISNTGVLSFNGRSGGVNLTSPDVTNALGYSPLTSVTTNGTLTGNGTGASPLGVALPFSGSAGTGPTDSAFVVTNTGTGYGVSGLSDSGIGVGGSGHDFGGFFGGGRAGVVGTTFNGYGVEGDSDSGPGVVGFTNSDNGVVGQGGPGNGSAGVLGETDNSTGFGVVGFTEKGTAVFAQTLGGPGLAGLFNGNVQITGALTSGVKDFKIDHPLDPENKYLYHTSVESPDMMNIYNGNALLDSNGEAVVELPDWFEALNKDFRYQLTAIGAPGPNLYIAKKVANNRFKIAGGAPGMEVSWQITGIRQDAYANAHRSPVEEEKPEKERGYYLHPDAFGQSKEKGIDWAQHPELMRRLKEKLEKRHQKQ